MQVIPVLDLMNGQVVRGIAGERARYRPMVSTLCASSEPLEVARGFRRHFGLDEFYVADLDAIEGKGPATAVYRQLQTDGFCLLVDAGVRQAEDARRLIECGVAGVIAGLETLVGPHELFTMVNLVGAEQVIFSLDMKNGRPLCGPSWPLDADAILALAVAAGVGRVLLLDLADVGMGGGLRTERLASQALARFPGIDLVVGGGVRGMEDLVRLKDLGVGGTLVASALHDGRLCRADVEAVAGP